MWLVRLAVEFRMELAGDEEWMFRQFDDLDQLAVRRVAAKSETGFLEHIFVSKS